MFGQDAPLPWLLASDAERVAGELTPDLCFLKMSDGPSFYIKGNLDIPVHDEEVDTFRWWVWISLSEQSMLRQLEHWDDPARTGLDPMFGWLMADLPGYEPSTVSLPAQLHTHAPGVAPLIELDHSVDHQLVHEQDQPAPRRRDQRNDPRQQVTKNLLRRHAGRALTRTVGTVPNVLPGQRRSSVSARRRCGTASVVCQQVPVPPDDVLPSTLDGLRGLLAVSTGDVRQHPELVVSADDVVGQACTKYRR